MGKTHIKGFDVLYLTPHVLVPLSQFLLPLFLKLLAVHYLPTLQSRVREIYSVQKCNLSVEICHRSMLVPRGELLSYNVRCSMLELHLQILYIMLRVNSLAVQTYMDNMQRILNYRLLSPARSSILYLVESISFVLAAKPIGLFSYL